MGRGEELGGWRGGVLSVAGLGGGHAGAGGVACLQQLGLQVEELQGQARGQLQGYRKGPKPSFC